MASAATLTATLVTRASLFPVHELREYHLLDDLHGHHFFDLKVYRRAAAVVSQSQPLYGTKLRHGLGFTYPPVAALMFMTLGWLSLHRAELAITVINVALAAAVVHLAIRLPRPRPVGEPADRGDERRKRRRLAAGWLAAAVALWIEPITTSVVYGQIDLLITALVIVDLVYGRRSRYGGLGIGIAAAIKLTPLVFIPYLIFTGRGRMATRALAAFAVSIAVAFAAVPRDAWTYWFGGKFIDLSRVTGATHLAGSGAANQSLRGALLRVLPGTPHVSLIWLAGSLMVGGLGLLLAVRAARRGDEAWGFLLTALSGLLVSPVSWTHHWAIAVAGAVAILGSGRRSALRALMVVAAIAVGLGASRIWADIRHPPVWSHVGATGLLLGNLYVVIGLVTLAAAATLELHHALQRRTRSGRRPILAPVVSAALPPASPLARRVPGHPGDPVRAITTSQALTPDRQSL
jgi:alpha-1,2-mannosyltransferase